MKEKCNLSRLVVPTLNMARAEDGVVVMTEMTRSWIFGTDPQACKLLNLSVRDEPKRRGQIGTMLSVPIYVTLDASRVDNPYFPTDTTDVMDMEFLVLSGDDLAEALPVSHEEER